MERTLTAPSSDAIDALSARKDDIEHTPATRSEAQRDRDRVLYSSALLRLGHVTQVAAPEVGHTFHSRLTHSLKVAQFARRLAERLKSLELEGPAERLVSSLDADAAEAAALAHDLGHPPFGHLAEQELNELARDEGGFEGNAQSFRILTRLALRAAEAPGLNLTRRTLNGVLKYPWRRDVEKQYKLDKWGAYEADEEHFNWARIGTVGEQRSLEAQIMDWADDVTYAVHDMDDFYRARLVPLDRLCSGGEELSDFRRYIVDKYETKGKSALGEALSETGDRVFRGLLSIDRPYHSRADERISLRAMGSGLITRYMNAVELVNATDKDVGFCVPDSIVYEVGVLKELTWFYIIERPSLALIHQGQREVIRAVFDLFATAAQRNDLRLFPAAFAERIEFAETEPAKRRIVVDMIAGMTEASATDVYLRTRGVSSGSLMTGGFSH
ncbi:MAG TPA: dNTP triphosphohydrolase [Dehalococcoidia bacterium]|nr:dNTP triphosphohydrolase [Dehalococcoidia bacterium]